MPWRGVTIVGTWYSREPKGPGAGLAPAELEAMLASVNASYGDWRFGAGDVLVFHVGLLPAIPASVEGEGEPVPMDKPRCEPATDTGGPAGLWYLQTEKWTTVRRLAQACVDRLAAENSLHARPSATRELPLPGGDVNEIEDARAKLRQSDLSSDAAQRIETGYGSRAAEVLEFIASSPAAEVVVPASGGVRVGELLHAMEREHARTLGDLLRRTGIGGAGRPARETLEFMARIAAAKLDWPDERQASQVAEVLQLPQYQLVQGTEARP
jgi:glycerol-3-phosphate dehydrogenase